MRTPLRILAGLALVAAAWPASAQCPADTTTTTPDDYTCYVATTGNDANSGTRQSPMATIQAALDRASLGTVYQIVRVLPGTYVECPYTIGGVDIASDAFLAGAVNTTTIIDGTTVCEPNGLPVVELGDNSSLRGFTIKGGGDSGVVAFGHVTIANNIIENSSTPTAGGGVYLQTGQDVSGDALAARIEGNTIRNNTSGLDGGGVFVYAAGIGEPSKVVIDSNKVQNNVAGDAAAEVAMFGGGIAVFADSFSDTDRSDVVITNNTIEGNEVKGLDTAYPSYGGGLSVATYGNATETIHVTSTNIVRNNLATNGYGGGIAALGQGQFPGTVAHEVLVESNAVSSNSASYGGGGIYALALNLGLGAEDQVEVSVIANDVSGNDTTGQNGTFGVTGGGGIYAEFFNEQTSHTANLLTVDGNTLRNNTSESYGGGAALWVRSFGEPLASDGPVATSSRLRFANNLVTGNTADDTQTGSNLGDGGGVYVYALGQGGASSAVDLKFNTVAGNTADTGFAGGAALDAVTLAGSTSPLGSTSTDVSSSIFLSNSGFAVGGASVPGVGNVTVRIAYNDTFQNGAAPFAPAYTSIAGPGNITSDPELDAYFVPLLCSPTIDAGDPAEGTILGQGGLQEERQPNGRRANLGHTGLTLNATVTLPDATGDALVDGVDILRLATSFASTSAVVDRYFSAADRDVDGDVDGNDLAYMSAWFGEACP